MENIMDRKYKIAGIILIFAYVVFSIGLARAVIKDYRLMALLWFVFIYSYFRFVPKVNSMGRLKYTDKINFDALISALAYFAARYLTGILIFNLGRSPYSFTFSGIMYNALNVVPQLVAREIVRFHLINTYCRKKRNDPAFYSLSVLMTLSNFNWKLIESVSGFEEIMQLIGKEVLPDLCESILLSFLSLYGTVLTPIIYVLTSFVFLWLMPILPDLNWFSESVLGTVIPAIMISYITTKYERMRRREKIISTKEQVETGIVLTFSVLLIWFVVGVFPIYPSVIATGSMEPMIYPGDIIIINQIRNKDDINELKVGDVIQFRRDNILITHRIVAIVKDRNGQLAFRTKGDNNSSEDTRLVYPNEVRGILVKVIPKLGYPTLLIKERKNTKIEGIEF